MVWLDFVGHLSFVLTALSFCVKDMIHLRVLAILSGLFGIFYNYNIEMGPLWLVIFWLSVFSLINLLRIGHLIWEKRSIHFSDEEKEVFATQFSSMTAVEFMKLTRIAEWQTYSSGTLLTEQGKPLSLLRLIYNGEVRVDKNGLEVARCRDGTLVGEVAFLQNTTATANVEVVRPTKCLAWKSSDLKSLLRRNPSMNVVMQGVLSADLTKKLMS